MHETALVHTHRSRASTLHHLVYPVPVVVAVWAVVPVRKVLADASGVCTAESVCAVIVLGVRLVH